MAPVLTEIKLDFDNLTEKGLLELIRSRWRFLFRFGWPSFGRLRVRSVDVRRTKHGYHVRIAVKNYIGKRDLNFLQLALGSDFRRECLNLRRIIACRQMKVWNVLFEYKFNRRGDLISRERLDVLLSKKILGLIKRFQRGVRFS
jgi:hypothetical protein